MYTQIHTPIVIRGGGEGGEGDLIAVFLNDFAFSGKPLNKNCRKRSDPANYRPVSVIPAVAKVFERIIYDQVYQYLTKNSFVTSHHIGFSFLAFRTYGTS